MKLRDVLAPLDEILKRHDIPYAVIGGYAVAAWGEVRATRDIDLYCNAVDLDRLKQALEGARLNFEHRPGDPDDHISHVVRIQAGTEAVPYEIDIVIGIRGSPPGILGRAHRLEIEGFYLPVASPEDTIILKLLAGSARDLEDALSILQLQKGRFSMSLLQELCPSRLAESLERLVQLSGERGGE